jgi:predicted GNAT superfamily acetyltransferase
MIEIRELKEEMIQEAHELSVEIFGAGATDEKHSIEKWKEHLKEGGLLLGAYDAGRLVGFKFGYQREPGSFHSWLGGVCEEYRRRGIARNLMERQEEWVRAHGYHFLTVNTYKDKFPAMYELLMSAGYQVTEQEGGKSFFRKKLLQ